MRQKQKKQPEQPAAPQKVKEWVFNVTKEKMIEQIKKIMKKTTEGRTEDDSVLISKPNEELEYENYRGEQALSQYVANEHSQLCGGDTFDCAS